MGEDYDEDEESFENSQATLDRSRDSSGEDSAQFFNEFSSWRKKPEA